MKRSLSMIFLLVSFAAVTFAQAPTSGAQVLTVGGEVSHPLKLSAADLAKLPRQTVSAKDHHGKTSTFEGLALVEILRLAGVEFGEKLRGKSLR